MINLMNDYCSVGHPEILKKLIEKQNNRYVGYGLDTETLSAKEAIKKAINNDSVDIHFIVGGTPTNKIFIAHALKPYEAVISCDSGHINVHETAAIEQTGHKILITKGVNGKITPNGIKEIVYKHVDEHMVKPRLVYISNSTEYGTIYSLNELKEISKLCKELDLLFYVDGARLSAALTSEYNDVTLEELTNLVDAYYIGGTKNGLLYGEALVIVNEELQKNFRYSLKHYGGMLAKGFITGIQFNELFNNNLFYEIGYHENKLAKLLSDGLKQLDIKFLMERQTNQIFPIFKKEIVNKLKEHILFELWEELETEYVIRFVTHFNLKEEEIIAALNIISTIEE